MTDLRPTLFPALRYADADAAVAWLRDAFGFEEHAVHRDEAGVVAHAELRLGGGLLMLGQARPGDWMGGEPPDPRRASAGIYAVMGDVDAHHARAAAAGAEITRAPADTDYGSREYAARDLEGNAWSFGTYDPFAAAQAGSA
jgi:uncharacterized glyoxalase superfamily protein PhnB